MNDEKLKGEEVQLVRVSYDDGQNPVIMGRDLHEALGIRTSYKDWFPRMCEYGFTEGRDFCSFLSESTGGRPRTNHRLSIEMAKEICMIQRTEIGKKCREYFLELERRWNSPESIMARALQFANQQLAMVMDQNQELRKENAIQSQQIAEMRPKTSYCDIVLACPDLLSVTQIAKDYGWSARRLNQWLEEQKIQFRQSGAWFLYQKFAEQGYTMTKTHVHPGTDGQPHTSVHTYWTQNGRLFIYDRMKADGNLPVIER